MERKLHRITGVDESTKTATCAICGPVPVKRRRKGRCSYWACRNAAKRIWIRWAQENHQELEAAKLRRLATSKKRCVEYAGGECVFCGYKRCMRALHFHHVDPGSKDFTLARGLKSWDKVRVEIEKCVLVCSNCHAEIHDGLISQEEVMNKFLAGIRAVAGA